MALQGMCQIEALRLPYAQYTAITPRGHDPLAIRSHSHSTPPWIIMRVKQAQKLPLDLHAAPGPLARGWSGRCWERDHRNFQAYEPHINTLKNNVKPIGMVRLRLVSWRACGSQRF
jgi:hypothetical protein